jgi:hypothetical protein
MHFARNSRTGNAVCGGMMKQEGSNHLQCPVEISSPSFSDGRGLQVNVFNSFWHQVVQILCELLRKNHARFFCLGDCGMYLTLPHDFRVIFEKLTSVTCCNPIKKMFSFQPFKHFCRHFVSTLFLTSFNYCGPIFEHFSHVQICVTIGGLYIH